MGEKVPTEEAGFYLSYVERSEQQPGLERIRMEFCSLDCLTDYVPEDKL